MAIVAAMSLMITCTLLVGFAAVLWEAYTVLTHWE